MLKEIQAEDDNQSLRFTQNKRGLETLEQKPATADLTHFKSRVIT